MDKNPSTILIIDDEPAMREALGDLLAEEGYYLSFAQSGAEGLAKATEIVPDLILLDVVMPDMDGFAVCRKLRADKLLAEVPIIMTTSLADRGSRLRGFAAGADDYVTKPVDEPELLARVRTTTRLNRYRRLLEEQIGREMAEEALDISETRYRSLFDSMPVGLYRSTPEGQILETNPALVEMLGYPDMETFLALNTIDGYIEPQDRQQWQAMMEQQGIVLGFETQWRRYDGTTIWIRENSRVIRDEKGQVLYYEGAVEDITERKQAEEELRKREAHQALVLGSLPMAFYTAQPYGDYGGTWVSDQINQIAGFTAEQFLADTHLWATRLHPEDRDYALDAFERLPDTETLEIEYRWQATDGRYVWLLDHAVLVRDDDGKPQEIIGTWLDITERKRAREALEDSLQKAAHGQVLLLALSEAAQAVQRARTPEEVYQTIGEEILKLGYQVSISILTEDEKHLALGYMTFDSALLQAAEKLTGLSAKDYRVRLTPGGFYEHLIAKGEPVFSDPGAGPIAEALPKAARPLAGKLAGLLGFHKAIYVPLKVGDKAYALLTVISAELTEDDIPAMTAFASQAAIAIENAQLYEQVRARSRYLETMQQINATLRSTLPLDQVLDKVTRGASEALDYVGSLIVIPDGASERLVMGAAWGGRFLDTAVKLTGLKVESFSLPLAATGNPIVQAYLNGQFQYWSGDPARIVGGVEPAISPKLAPAIAQAMGAKGAACVPLIAGDRVLGVLVVFPSREHLPDEERTMLMGLAGQAGLAIQNAQLYQTAQQERDRAQRYLDIAGVMLVAIDAEGDIILINRKGCEILGCEEDRILGKNWFATCLPSEIKKTVKSVFDQLIAGETEPVEYYENPVVTKSGEERLIAWHNTVLRDEAGDIVGTLSSGEDITERAQAEKALRESEKNYRSVVDNANVGIVVIQEGKLVFHNARMPEILSYSEEEYQQVDFTATIHPDDRDLAIDRIRKRVKGEAIGSEGAEIRLITKSGETRWVQANSSVIHWEGKPAVQAFVSDITERKQVEAALLESEEKYRNVVEHAHEAIVVIQDEMFKFFNPKTVELTGYSGEELASISLAEIIHPKDREAGFARQQKRLEGEDIPPVEVVRIIDKQGNVKWVENNSIVITWEGKPAMLHFVNDITERIRSEQERAEAEEALRQSEEKFRSVVEQASDGIVLADEQGNIIEWNQAEEQITGVKRENVLGRPIWDIQFQAIPQERRDEAQYERIKAAQLELLETGQAPWRDHILEHPIQRPDGTRRTLQVVAFPIKTEKGFIVGSASRDITERKKAQEEMQKLATVVTHSSELVNLATLEGQMIFINEAGSKMLGIEPDEVEQHVIFEVIPKDLLPKVQEEVLPGIMNQGGWEGELQYLNIKTGKLTDVYATTFLITDPETGAPLYLANVSLDITERKQAEVALRESEETARALLNATNDLAILIAPSGDILASNEMAAQAAGIDIDDLIGATIGDFLSPDLLEIGTAQADQVQSSGEAIRFQAEREGATLDISIYPVFDAQGALARFAVFARDITEQIKTRQAIEQRSRELAALNEIGQAVISTLDLQEMLTLIAEHTNQLMGMAATSIVLREETDDGLYFAAASGAGADSIVGKRLAIDQGVAGWVVQHSKPVLIPDVSQDARWYGSFDAQIGFATRSILCVPLKSKDRTIGALEALNKPGGFTKDDLHLLSTMAAPVATAIDNARLFKEVRVGREQLQSLSRRLVEMQEAERAHVARELHDETGQSLSSMLLNLGLMEQEADQPDTVIARTNEMIVMVDDMLENLHRLAMNLRPATLDHLGLLPALEQFVETFEEQYSIETQFEIVGLGSDRLPPEMETALYRIVQESLTNVARHAQATRVDVLVARRDDQVVTIVEDNGSGFDPETAMQTSRMGLLGMRERAEMLNGRLVIESVPGSGTTVLVEVPYQTA